MKECVDDLDRAWSYKLDAYVEASSDVEHARFSEAVRYMHIFLRTKPGNVVFQSKVPEGEAGAAIAALEAAWRPEDASLPQRDRMGRYDDSLDDGVVRTAHLTMKGILAAAEDLMNQ
jgi:hypothetical protein